MHESARGSGLGTEREQGYETAIAIDYSSNGEYLSRYKYTIFTLG